jgi:hypothetical protein
VVGETADGGVAMGTFYGNGMMRKNDAKTEPLTGVLIEPSRH